MLKAELFKPNDEQLIWAWAYREQLRLLDGIDSRGIHCAVNGWDDDSWHNFRNEYGLRQGHQAEFGKKLEQVLNKVECFFKEKLPVVNTTDELKNRWFKGVKLIGQLAEKKKKDNTDPELWSMTSKLLWFYHPTEMTMYDTYAKEALASEMKCRIKPNNFLCVFERLFSEKLPSINDAAKFSDRKYPYPRRVLDKWLWLKGSGQEEERLKQFRLSLERAPIRFAPAA